jgi:hypothetical protein
MAKKKLVVCCPYPNHGSVSAETRESVDALRADEELDVQVAYTRGSSISMGRNMCINNGVSQARKQMGFWGDYYLMLDADIKFNVEHVKTLIAADKDIVSGAYNDRAMPSKIVAGGYDEDGICHRETTFLNDSDRGLRKVRFTGAGFLLIKRGVLEALEFPWFRETVVTYGKDDANACCVGEDIGFCQHAEAAGYEIWCDCDCKVEHLLNYNHAAGPCGWDTVEIQKTAENIAKVRDELETEINKKRVLISEAENAIFKLQLQAADVNGQLYILSTLLKR